MKTVIEEEHPEGWGRVLELPFNKDRYRLEFHSHRLIQKKMALNPVNGQVPSLTTTFTSVGHLKDNYVCVVGEEISTSKEACFMY